MNPKNISSISELDNLVGPIPKEREEMEVVTQTFPFRSNEYYLSLIAWKDGHDPLKKIVIPDSHELETGGSADPSCEKNYTKKPGLHHKYDQTGLLLLSDVCGGICRFYGQVKNARNNEMEDPGLSRIGIRKMVEYTTVVISRYHAGFRYTVERLLWGMESPLWDVDRFYRMDKERHMGG